MLEPGARVQAQARAAAVAAGNEKRAGILSGAGSTGNGNGNGTGTGRPAGARGSARARAHSEARMPFSRALTQSQSQSQASSQSSQHQQRGGADRPPATPPSRATLSRHGARAALSFAATAIPVGGASGSPDRTAAAYAAAAASASASAAAAAGAAGCSQGWSTRGGEQAMQSQALLYARSQLYRGPVRAGGTALPADRVLAPAAVQDLLLSLHPGDFSSSYACITTNLSLPRIHGAQYGTEAHEAFVPQRPSTSAATGAVCGVTGPDVGTPRHFKFGHLVDAKAYAKLVPSA